MMVKSKSYFIRKLLTGRSCHKTRTDVNWTDDYSSPELSWPARTVNKVGDWIYSKIDNFFQGSANSDFNRTLPYPDKFRTTCIEWELNQDIADIALNDIKITFRWILPAFISKYTFRLHQLILLYLFTDVVFEKESQKLPDFQHNEVKHTDADKKIVMSSLQVIKERFDSKCLSINDWLKELYIRLKIFLRLKQNRQTYYLLGYFAPQSNDYPQNDQIFMIRGPDKAILNPAFSIHKRI